MQRISDVFSRWLEDAFNESTNHPNSQSGTNEEGNDHESISGPGSPGNTDQSTCSPQPETFENSEVGECTVMNEPLKDDDINPVEDMVEVLDLDGSETGDSMSNFHVGSNEKPTGRVLDEVVNNNCDVEEAAPLLDRVQKQEGKTNYVAEKLINNEGEFNNSVETQQTLSGRQQLCACGSNAGFFEESCSVSPSSSLDSGKASVINGNAVPCLLPLNAAQFEEQSTSLKHCKEGKQRASCEMKADVFADGGESISPNSTNFQSSSLFPSEDLGIVGDSDEILESQNTLEVKKRRILADDSGLNSSTENSPACRDSDNSNHSSEYSTITGAEDKNPNEVELDGITERNLNCRTTHQHCEYENERLKNCNSNNDRKTTAQKMYNIDENSGYVKTELAVEGSKDLHSKVNSLVNIDAEKEDHAKSDILINKNDQCETFMSTHALPNRVTGNEEEFDEMKLSTVSMDCTSHERSLDDDASAENASADSHSTEVDSLGRPGISDETSARELPSGARTAVASSTRIGPLRDISARRRHAAATRIQRCFRLQKKKNETYADNEEDMTHNFDMATPLMCYKGHRNARTMVWN